MTDKPLGTRKYRVKLGYSEALVECSSKEEAIQLARARFSADCPNLYDVIHQAGDEQFQVSQVQGDSAQ